jgi:hypothetical protein
MTRLLYRAMSKNTAQISKMAEQKCAAIAARGAPVAKADVPLSKAAGTGRRASKRQSSSRFIRIGGFCAKLT